ncbi:uncharacterized protein LOC126666203 isoform X2 [Mercurialis annua]|nr:uncharacterized protein LOC126666203 isoform X2 [Mercurialis annua]
MPCSSQAELLSSKKPFQSHGPSELKHLSSGMDVTDRSMKLLNAHQQYNVGRSIFLKRSRHNYGHHYSQRNSRNHANASTSHGKNASLQDEKFLSKLTSQSGIGLWYPAENGGKSFNRPDRIKLSSSTVDASDGAKKTCGVCQKMLRRKPCFLGDTLSSGECSIVAVLVCGHVYHAECLEQRTSLEERRDPPCPLCTGLHSHNGT